MIYKQLWAVLATAFLLLFAQGGLLAALCLLEACHESALLAGLGGVGHHAVAHFLLVDATAEDICLNDRNQQRQEVVVAKMLVIELP